MQRGPVFGMLLLSGWMACGQTPVPGRVVDDKTGKGVPFALIQYGHDHESGTADENGYFIISVHDVPFHVHVQAIGYRHAHAEWTTIPDSLRIPLDPESYSIDEVTVSVERKSAAISSSATVVLADREKLRQNWSNTLSATLLSIPGVQSMNTGVGIGKPVIRGFLGTRIQVNDHGIKQEGQQWGMDHGLDIDPFSVEEVEVVRGAQALAYGPDATGGVVNLRPATLPTARWSGEATGLYQSVNQSIGVTAQTAYRGERIWLRGRLSGQDFGDYSVPADTFVYNTYVLPIGNRQLKNTSGQQVSGQIAAGALYREHRFKGRLSYYEQRTGIFPGAIGIPRAYNLADDGDRRNIDLPYQHNSHLRVSAHHRYQGQRWQWITDMGYQKNQREEHSVPHLHGDTTDPDNSLALDLDLRTATLNTRGFLYSGQHKHQWGVQAEYQVNRHDGFEFLIPSYERILGGVYYLDEWTFTRYTLNAGIRFDVARYGPGQEVSYQNVSAAFGWRYHWSDLFTTRFNVARTFRAPNIAELAANGVHHGTFRHEIGSSANRPEIGYQFDLEAVYTNRKGRFELSPYFNYFTNFLFLRPTAEFSLLPEAGQIFRYGQTRAVHTGAEAMITWLPRAIESVDIGMEYVYGFNMDDNLPLPFMPPFSALARWKREWHLHLFGSEDWETEVQYRYTGAQNQVDRNEKPTPDYHMVHLAVGNEWSKDNILWGLRVECRNILNTDYLQHLSRYRFLHLPEPGRNWVAQLYFKW